MHVVYISGHALLRESCHLQLCTWFMFPVMPHYVQTVIFSYAHGLCFRSCPTMCKLSSSAMHMVYVSGHAPLCESFHLLQFTLSQCLSLEYISLSFYLEHYVIINSWQRRIADKGIILSTSIKRFYSI